MFKFNNTMKKTFKFLIKSCFNIHFFKLTIILNHLCSLGYNTKKASTAQSRYKAVSELSGVL